MDIGLCSKVCLDLLEGLNVYGLHLYTDNYYTSPSLFLHLYKNLGINACGTCRSNRIGFPKELVTKATKQNRGHYDYRSNGPIVASDSALYISFVLCMLVSSILVERVW